MSRDIRNFINTCNENEKLFQDTNTKEQIEKHLNSILEIVKGKCPPNTSSFPKYDFGVYTGAGGIAFAFWKYSLSSICKEKENAFSIAQNYLKISLEMLRYKQTKRSAIDMGVSFLEETSGPISMAIIFNEQKNNLVESKKFLEELYSLSSMFLAEDDVDSNEMLYGRVGYLYSILFVKKYAPKTCDLVFPAHTFDLFLEKLVDKLILEGKTNAFDLITGLPITLGKSTTTTSTNNNNNNYSSTNISATTNNNEVLMFEWHHKKYLGAAHGLSGILFILLSCPWKVIEKHKIILQNTLDWLFDLNLKTTNKNFPSSIGGGPNKRLNDTLVQWCHGAPGFLYLYLKAFEIFGHQDEKKKQLYLEKAIECSEVIWRHGLLKKGLGLCHGISGNAYCFLELYRITKNAERDLNRAFHFAKFGLNYDNPKYGFNTPDTPYSLFEGLSGSICFSVDLLSNPNSAIFPAYQL